MSKIDKIVDNMRDLKLNENFKAQLIRRFEKNDCILRILFHWEEKDFKVFWNQKFYKYKLDFDFKSGYKEELNEELIKQFNNTGEAPDLF